MLKKCIQKLRETAPFHLVKGKIKFFKKAKYPFRHFIPLLCQVVDNKKNDGIAFQSCNRSMVLALNGSWLKCKAIGIPYGVSQPFLIDDRIYTYRLIDDPTIGYDIASWGFHNNPESEILGMKVAYENGLPAPEPVGWAEYDNIFGLDVRDKNEIFMLHKKFSREKVFDRMLKYSKPVKGGCLFCIQESDIRVDEVLSAFAYPFLSRIQDLKECSDYVEWLGFSCGHNLKLHHECGFLHGCKQRPSGEWRGKFMTNSYAGNHVVGETRTWLTDYDMFCKIENSSLMNLELEGLLHLMNPLFPYQYGVKYRDEFREKLALCYENGVKKGYNNDYFDVESKLKKDMLNKATEIQEEVWKLLGLKKAYIRSVHSNFYLDFLKSNKIDKKKLINVINKLKN